MVNKYSRSESNGLKLEARVYYNHGVKTHLECVLSKEEGLYSAP